MTPRQALCRARRLIPILVWLVTLAASSARAAPAVVRVYSPAAGERLADLQYVVVQVSSAVPIADVSAVLADKTVTLTARSDGFFSGLLALDGVPSGSKLLTTTATDVNGQKSQTTVRVLIDRDPILTVQSPGDFSVWTGDVSLAATCVDDSSGGCLVRAVVDGATKVIATNRLAQRLPLRPTASGVHTVQFRATDRLQHTSSQTAIVFESGAHALPVDFTPRHTLLDATADRLLSATDGFASMMITDRAARTTETIERPADTRAFDGRGKLTEHGALFALIDESLASESLWEWRDGAFYSLGTLASGGRVAAEGSFVAWLSPLSSVTGQEVLRLRNFVTGITSDVDILTRSPFGEIDEFDLTADGVLTYSKPSPGGSAIWRYANGASAPITFAPPGAYDTAPRSDGTLTVFTRRSFADGTTSILLNDGGQEETLAACEGERCHPRPGADYDVTDGWVAFTRRVLNGTSSLWLRRPDGTVRQLSALAPAGSSTPSHEILAMGMGGSVQFERRLTDGENEPVVQLYDTPTGRTPSIVLESNGGRPVWIDDRVYVMLGDALLRVATPPVRPLITIDLPGGEWVPSVFDVAGWTLDKTAMDGAGIDTVHVWGFPSDGGAPTFLGAAALGAARPDVASAFGAQYARAGFALSASLPAGVWRLTAYAHSAFTNTFVTATSVTARVVSTSAHVVVDAPTGGTVRGSFLVTGWALDLAAGAARAGDPGTGVDVVHVYAYRDNGQAVFLGAAAYGDARADVARRWGSPYVNSGFHLSVTNLPPGHYRLAVFARRTASFTFAPAQVRDVTIRP